MKSALVLSCLLLLLSGCTINYTFGEDEAPEKTSYFEEKAKPVNDLLIFGPQPEQNDLSELKDNNIQKVISFRTPEEIEKLEYQQATALEELGIEFANIPIGGDDHPYSPATYNALIDELAGISAEDGPVLLHCKSGWRASVVGVAYLVKHQGMPLDEAVEYAVGWWPMSLEKVLGTELTLQEQRR